MLIGDARKRVQARAFSASQDNTLHLYGFSLRWKKLPVALMLPQAPESSGDKIRVSQRVQDSRYGRSSFLAIPLTEHAFVQGAKHFLRTRASRADASLRKPTGRSVTVPKHSGKAHDPFAWIIFI